MTFARSNCVLSKALHRKVKENERLHRFLVPKDFLLSASRFRFEVHLFTTTEGNRFVKRNDTAIFDVNDQYTWHAILTRTDHEINPRENKEVCPHLVPRMYVSLSADGQRVPFYESGEEFLFHLPPTPPRLSESEKEKVELEFLPLKDQKKQRECVWELQPLSDANEPLPGGITLSNRPQSNSNSSSPASSRSLSSSLYNDDTSLSSPSSSSRAGSSSSLLDTPLYGVSEGVLFSRLREDWGAGAPHSALTPLLRFRKNEAVDLPRIIRPAAHALRLTASALPPPPCLSGSGPSSSVSSPSSLSRRSNSPSVSMDDGDISPWGSPGKRARGLSHESPTAALPLPPALSIALPAAPTDGVELVYQWNDPQMPPQIRLERQLAYVAFDVVQQGRVRSVYHPWHSDLFLMSRDAVGCFLYFNPRQRHVFENVATHLDNNELLVQGRFLWEASDIRESRFEIQLAPALSMTISQPNLAVLNLDEFLPDPALSFSAPSHLMDTAPSLSLHGHGGLSFPSFPSSSSSSSAPGTSASMASSFFPNSIDALLGRHLNSDGFLGLGMGMGMGSVGEGSDCFSMPADTVPINFSTPEKEPLTPLCGEADHGDDISSSRSTETCHKNTSPTPACCDKVDYATTPEEGGDKVDTWTGATTGVSTSDETIDDDDDEDILREFVKISMEDVPSPAALSASPSGCSSVIPRKKKQAPRMCVKTEAGCVLM